MNKFKWPLRANGTCKSIGELTTLERRTLIQMIDNKITAQGCSPTVQAFIDRCIFKAEEMLANGLVDGDPLPGEAA